MHPYSTWHVWGIIYEYGYEYGDIDRPMEERESSVLQHAYLPGILEDDIRINIIGF